MLLARNNDSSNYENVLLNDNKIEGFYDIGEKNTGVINTGIYLLEPEILDYIPKNRRVSLEREVFPNIIGKGLFGKIYDCHFVDIERPETYKQFRQNFLNKLKISPDSTVREAIKLIRANKTDFLYVTDEDNKLLGVLNDNIILNFLREDGKVEQSVLDVMVRDPVRVARVNDDEEKIHILASGTRHLPILDDEGRVYDIRFHTEEVAKKTFPIVRGKSPLRISFAGGGTDMPYFFEKYGGTVISSTIDKHCHATAKKRADSKITIESDMNPKESVFDSRNLKYDGQFDLLKAVFNVVKPDFGVDFYLYNDVPPGRGLGSSASFAVLIAKMLGGLQGINYEDESLAEIAYKSEVEQLKIKGGKQDQYAALFGGFNWIEFERDNKKIMHPLRLKENTMDELRDHLMLVYTGQAHHAGIQHGEQEKNYKENEEITRRLQSLKNVAREVKENLLSSKPNFERVGELLHHSWMEKRNISKNMSDNGIDELYDLGIKNGAYGGKLLGAGGGGYLLFVHSPKKRNQLVNILHDNNKEILDFDFEKKGTKVWYVEK